MHNISHLQIPNYLKAVELSQVSNLKGSSSGIISHRFIYSNIIILVTEAWSLE
jgi:hypothetical protein